MRVWSIRTTVLACTLVLLVACCPLAAHASLTSYTESAVPAPVDETPVFQAIRDSVNRLETALHHKVASVLTSKVEEIVAGTSYESTWQVTVKYWLDYRRPDDVPYLKGMQKCLAESKASATKDWLEWAEAQVARQRSDYAEQIAFQQECTLQVAVTATLDQAGKIVASTLRVLHVVSDSESLSMSAEALAVPSDRQLEQAGYDFLKAPPKAQSQSSGGQTTPSTSQPQSQSPTNTEGQVARPSSTQGAWVSNNPNQAILGIGIAVLAALMLLLVLNQYIVRHRRR